MEDLDNLTLFMNQTKIQGTHLGYESLADVYTYMNDLAFDIKLKSDYCVMVGQKLAYEIGVWKTSDYEENYTIIWKKMGG